MTHKWLEILADCVLDDDIRPVKMVTLPLLLITCVGFSLQSLHDPDNELQWLLKLVPSICWVSAFATVFVARFVGIFVWRGTRMFMVGIPGIAILLWCFIFYSSAIMSPFGGLEILYLLPAVMEAWILSRQIGVPHGSV